MADEFPKVRGIPSCINLSTYVQGMSDYELLCEVIQVVNKLSELASLSVITYADPLQWNITTQYSANTVVVDPETGVAYLSKQPVPAGVQIFDTDYWAKIANFDGIYNQLISAITNTVYEKFGMPAREAIKTDSLVWVDNVLYKCVTPVSAGQNILSTSFIQTNLDTEFENLVEQYKEIVENTTADLNRRLSSIIANGTQTEGNAELIDIRTGADRKVYPTAGDAVRGQFGELKDDLVNLAQENRNFTFTGKFIPYAMGFVRGNLNPSTGEISTASNRVSTVNSMIAPKRITIEVEEGFRVFVDVNLGDTWGGNWYTGRHEISKDIEFKLIIARVTEDESETVSVNDFVSKISFNDTIVTEIEDIKSLSNTLYTSLYENAVLVCDKNDSRLENKYVKTDGKAVENDAFRKLGITGLKGGEKFLYNGVLHKELAPIAVFYNADAEVIGTYTADIGEKPFGAVINEEITIPDNTLTVNFNWFHRYDNFVLSLYRVDNFVKHEKSIFDGANLCVNGDSVSTEVSGRWCVMLNAIYPFGKYTNIAVGGTTIIDQINSQDRVNQIPTDTDIIITGGTTNDWAKNKTIGSMSTLDDSSTLYGALHLYFQRLNARVPNAMKVMFSNSLAAFPNRFTESSNTSIGIYNNLDKPMIDYIKAVKEVCEFDSIYYIPVYEECGINVFNYENYISNETPEGSSYQVFAHPNEAGAIKMTKVFRDYLERYYNSFKNL